MMPILCCVISHIGNSCENQEDNFLLNKGVYTTPTLRERMADFRQPFSQKCELNKHRFLVAVSDGMGGHASGEIASLMTVEYMSDHYDEIIEAIRLGENSLATQISYINNVVSSKAKRDSSCRGMGATLCGLIANEYELVGFNVGDSRMYQLRNGELRLVSTDHTEGQRLIRMNLLTEDEVSNFPRRKYLYKHIGLDGEVIPDLFRVTSAEPGTILLLCTDGLSDVVSDEEMKQILTSVADIEEKATRLVNKAVSRNLGHGDNITVILVEF